MSKFLFSPEGGQYILIMLLFLLTGCSSSLPKERIDSYGVPMVLIPEGEFIMGASESQANLRDENAMPAHTVFLDSYYIDKYETPNIVYQACVDAGGCSPLKRESRAIHDLYYSEDVYDKSPVMYLSWEDAKNYCEWRGARLPTEAEWEKAARGTDGRTYPWGEEIDCSYAAYGDYEKKRGCANGMILPMGNYPKNVSPYGVFDMAGNVSEWVEDCYIEDFYMQTNGKGKIINPVAIGEHNCSRIYRGGAAGTSEVSIATFKRQPITFNYRDYWTGVRCAWSP